jgi:hypothetical protein
MVYFYVDDILLFTKKHTNYGRELGDLFFKKFECKDLGQVKRFNGVWVDFLPDFGGVTLHQRVYCEKIVERFKNWWSYCYNTAKKMPLPQDAQERLAQEENKPVLGDKDFDWYNSFPFLEMIGASLYLAINTRLDIMYTVCMLARYSRERTVASCKLLAWLFSYLSGTIHIGITFTSFVGDTFEEVLDLLGFSDADWASDLRTRRSTAGNVVFACGGPLAWGSKLMATIAASSMESEYMASYFLGQQILYIRNLLGELSLSLKKPTPFLMDAMAAIQALRNPTFHARTKHVAVKWRWLQSHNGNDFDVKHVRSLDMTADLLTKMPNSHVWSTLLSHLLGHESRLSADLIQAQERPKDTDFPSKGLGNP